MTDLLPCPLCSQMIADGPAIVERPRWFYADHTSRARGVRCAILSGCIHARTHSQLAIVVAAEAEPAVLAWNAEAERLLAVRTAGWPEHVQARFRAAIHWPAPPPAAATQSNPL